MLFLNSRLLRSPSKAVSKRGPSEPILSPAVICSLYRRLYREVRVLDSNPLAKFLFPCTKELQEVTGLSGPLYVPSKSYVAVLQAAFRDTSKAPRISLAFDTLTRLRAHHENVQDKLPAMEKDRDSIIAMMKSSATQRQLPHSLFRAETVAPGASPAATRPPVRVAAAAVSTRFPAGVIRRPDGSTSPELSEGTVLVAHPLSSTHVDRRVMMITERTALLTSAVVLDLQFTYPLSRGNPMFPEVFWGHDVYDGGFSQIGFTMPPTAQITLLHTLEPDLPAAIAAAAKESNTEEEVDVVEDDEGAREDLSAAAHSDSSTATGEKTAPTSRWRRWVEARSSRSSDSARDAKTRLANDDRRRWRDSEARLAMAVARAHRDHETLCYPLIRGRTLADGVVEPTLYMSKVEALPYLAKLAMGKPRSMLRVFWGSMRWTTMQIENEVANGHWIPVRVSPLFFRPYALHPPPPTHAAPAGAHVPPSMSRAYFHEAVTNATRDNGQCPASTQDDSTSPPHHYPSNSNSNTTTTNNNSEDSDESDTNSHSRMSRASVDTHGSSAEDKPLRRAPPREHTRRDVSSPLRAGTTDSVHSSDTGKYDEDESEDCFPTREQLSAVRALRRRRYGADVSLPQVFPPDQILRRREFLWDEVMYALGGEYASLVGCNNPFAGQSRWTVPQILAPSATRRVRGPDGWGSRGTRRSRAAEAAVSGAVSRIDEHDEDTNANDDNHSNNDEEEQVGSAKYDDGGVHVQESEMSNMSLPEQMGDDDDDGEEFVVQVELPETAEDMHNVTEEEMRFMHRVVQDSEETHDRVDDVADMSDRPLPAPIREGRTPRGGETDRDSDDKNGKGKSSS